MAESQRTAASYDEIARRRAGDWKSKESPFRFFNNYVKKSIIQFALDHLKYKEGCSEVKVLDLASGRGGDVGKWLHCQSPELSFATAKLPRQRLTKAVFLDCYDVSSECIAEARKRYEALGSGVTCKCVFTVRDCFSEEFLCGQLPLSENYGKFHVVSIQFAFHYACDTRRRIDMLMAAIAGALASNGVFIATTVDDEVLAERVREKRTESTGLYALHFDSEPVWEGDRLAVGTKYLFELEGFVDCEEYVVPASYVRERAYYYGLEEVTEYSKTFRSFYEEYKKDSTKNKGFYLFRGYLELVTLYRTFCFRKIN
ncbi:mRNA capping methyltransferase [Trypanosoma cruzi]|uniref:mRNA (guanine-N(7))-methyltransferase n=1 Tax=Trypanosoma cruzi (strain CL Brener) TaxID=353153 RepID=Q4D3T7_TRYCC|nr:mRNA capping methyltransferase, putative [Trypanosoma cruzi]EAN87185.1 mRNA capping methyltransferase, putative [Trypanosoma cruzi]RNC60234.1 mRNA capping methyltransferase [Trypanosoma cruzi]|eukprot:XP_809036.1 mRNA capping methyltransferase [Trypanosoma cruzi strain CL Brener]